MNSNPRFFMTLNPKEYKASREYMYNVDIASREYVYNVDIAPVYHSVSIPKEDERTCIYSYCTTLFIDLSV